MKTSDLKPGDIIILGNRLSFTLVVQRDSGVTKYPYPALITKTNACCQESWAPFEVIIDGVTANLRIYNSRFPNKCVIKGPGHVTVTKTADPSHGPQFVPTTDTQKIL